MPQGQPISFDSSHYTKGQLMGGSHGEVPEYDVEEYDEESKEDIDHPAPKKFHFGASDFRKRDLRLDPRSRLYQPHLSANKALHILGDPAEDQYLLADNQPLSNQMLQQLFEYSDDDDRDVGENEGLDVNNTGNAGAKLRMYMLRMMRSRQRAL
jgi:hypothetical protein